jgi:hypothetical protein
MSFVRYSLIAVVTALGLYAILIFATPLLPLSSQGLPSAAFLFGLPVVGASD